MTDREALLASNPFPGLRPFEADEAERFFGRAEHIADLARRLQAVNFLAVTGESGCGKSSLVRAGLLGRLQAEQDADGRPAWRCRVLRPGEHPIAALAQALAPLLLDGNADPLAQDLLFGRLRIGERGLIDAVALADLPPGLRLLVVVDQFEEVFRFGPLRDEAEAFVSLLLAVAQDAGSAVSVVITMRSDMLGACADHRGLPEAVSQGQYLVPRLTRPQRKQAIVGPIELRGQRIEPLLVQRLLNDVSDASDDLPVLQHVLARTWQHWARTGQPDHAIGLADYLAVGGAANAISWHATEVCQDLPKLDGVIEQVFRALTERVGDSAGRLRGAEGLQRRRPLPMAVLRDIVDAPAAQTDQVVERFRRADTGFLAGGPALADNPVIDLAHESLIRLWDRMRGWIDAESDAADRLRLLVKMAQENAQHEGPLLERKSLKDAVKWFGPQGPRPAWVALCLGTDRAAADQNLALARRYLGQSRRRRLRRVTLPLLLLLLPAVWLAFDVQSRHSASAQLTTLALNERDQSPARSAMLALGALDRDDGNAMALLALRDALAALEVAHIDRVLPGPSEVRQLHRSPDRSRLLVVGSTSLRLLDAATLAPLGAALQSADALADADITGDNSTVVMRAEDFSLRARRLDEPGVAKLACPDANDPVMVTAVSPVGDTVALGCYSGDVLVGSIRGGAFMPRHHLQHHAKRGHATALTALAFSHDGKVLASGDKGGRINVWQLDKPLRPGGGALVGESASGKHESPMKHGNAINSLHFHAADNALLVSASQDASAVVWKLDFAAGKLAATPHPKTDKNHWVLKHDRAVTGAMFSPGRKDDYPVITFEGKSVQVWDDEDRKRRSRLHDNWVQQVDPSLDGRQFVTASDDGTARLWSVETGVPLAVLRGHRDAVSAALFLGPDARRLVTLGLEGQGLVWQLDPPTLVQTSERWILGAMLSPDGARLAVADENKVVIVAASASADAAPASAAGAAERVLIPESLSTLSWSSDGRYLAGLAQGPDKDSWFRLKIYDSVSGRQLPFRPKYGVLKGVFARDRNELLTWDTAQLKLWDGATLAQPSPEPVLRIDAPGRLVQALAISPDGGWFAMSDGKQIKLWARAHPSDPPRLLLGHEGTVTDLRFSPDGRHLLSASTDRTARVWAVAGGDAKPDVLTGNTSSQVSVAFDPQGRRILTGGTDGRVAVWQFDPDARDADARIRRLVTLGWHNEVVNTVGFGSDGQSILSASDDGTVRQGRCKVCSMDLAQLREAAQRLTTVSAADRARIDRDLRAATGPMARLLAWLRPRPPPAAKPP